MLEDQDVVVWFQVLERLMSVGLNSHVWMSIGFWQLFGKVVCQMGVRSVFPPQKSIFLF